LAVDGEKSHLIPSAK